MKTSQRLLPLFILQIIPLIIPYIIVPDKISTTIAAQAGVAGVLCLVLAYGLYRGRPGALSLAIFVQGLNVIIRLMMFFPHAMNAAGQLDLAYISLNLVAMAISTWFMLRLDKPDVRSTLVA